MIAALLRRAPAHVAVEAVDAGVQLAADEPFRVRRLPVEHACPTGATIRARRRTSPRTLQDRVRPRHRSFRRVTCAGRRNAGGGGNVRSSLRRSAYSAVFCWSAHGRKDSVPSPGRWRGTECCAPNASCGPRSRRTRRGCRAGRMAVLHAGGSDVDPAAERLPEDRGPEQAAERREHRRRRRSMTTKPTTTCDGSSRRSRPRSSRNLGRHVAARRRIRSSMALLERRHQEGDGNRQRQVDERADDAGEQARPARRRRP